MTAAPASDDALFETLRQALDGSACLSFEWSFKILPDKVLERDKVVCWVHHARHRASREIAACRALLGDVAILNDVPDDRIINLGMGIGAGRWHLYLQHVQADGCERYVACDGSTIATYRFHYFPVTPQMAAPDRFVGARLRPMFRELASDPHLQAMSGFWLRSRGDAVDQVCLAYTHRPQLKTLLPRLQACTTANLRQYEHVHIKHLAFNADGSMTVYVSAPTEGFPADVRAMKQAVDAGAARSALQIADFLRGLPFRPRERNAALDDFYSPADLAGWRKLLGADMYYHFGLFTADDDPHDTWNDVPFHRAVVDLCRHVATGDRVYDLGCGFGGVAKYLRDVRQCTVLGATISRMQFQYCHNLGIPCRYTDMEASLPPGLFDTILMCESLEHVRNKFALLKTLRRFTKRLVIRIHTQESPAQNLVFGDTMHVVSSACITGMLQACGYRIVHCEDRRVQAMPTIAVLQARLAATAVAPDPHLATLKAFVQRVAAAPDAWAREHLLLDIVAV